MNITIGYKRLKHFFCRKNFRINLSSDTCEEQIEFYIKTIEHGAVDIAWTATYASESSRGLIDEKAAKCVEVVFYEIFHNRNFFVHLRLSSVSKQWRLKKLRNPKVHGNQ